MCRPLFQSLFWWKYCPGAGASGLPPVGPRQCFNPCSGGSIALGRRSLAPGLRALSVSILVLVEVLPWVATDVLARLRAQRFQSLFWWKYCPGAKVRYVQGPHHLVSILVLVEVLPWADYLRPRCGPGCGVSILVLVEVLPWVGIPIGKKAIYLQFQSLFWWKYCPG